MIVGSNYETRVERLLGAPLATDAIRGWPQSGEVLAVESVLPRPSHAFRISS
jgi:hypothetical protein